MTEYDELLDRVIADPTNDTPRAALAQYFRPFRPELARMIDLQLERGRQRRGNPTGIHSPTREEQQLLEKNDAEWTRSLNKYTRDHEFDRGFVYYILIDPLTFLEYGDYLLANAPIRSVVFSMFDTGPFPMDELAASPLLARLDVIGFHMQRLTEKQVETFVASPHIADLLWLDLTGISIRARMWDLFAQTPATKKLLSIGGSTVDGYPGDRYVQDDEGWRWSWESMGERGRELERKYGYLPWLHREETDCAYDARYFVNLGKHPLRPVGSPVE